MSWLTGPVMDHLTALAELDHDDAVLREMEAHADEHGFPIVGRAAGRFLEACARMVGARRVMELGSGYGYSAYWFARAVGPEGTIVCTDGDPTNAEKAQDWLTRAGSWDQVTWHVGDALEGMAATEGDFDVVYCDVDKHGYPDCWEAARQRIRVGGIYLCDNVLWDGRVVDGSDRPGLDGWTAAIQEMNHAASADPDWTTTIAPIRDGILLAVRIS